MRFLAHHLGKFALPLFFYALCTLFMLIHVLFSSVWSLEIRFVREISPVRDDPFPTLARWGSSKTLRRELASVHFYRTYLNMLSWDEVHLKIKYKRQSLVIYFSLLYLHISLETG